MEKRYSIILITDAIKLRLTLIDYIIIHELCHIRYVNQQYKEEGWSETK